MGGTLQQERGGLGVKCEGNLTHVTATTKINKKLTKLISLCRQFLRAFIRKHFLLLLIFQKFLKNFFSFFYKLFLTRDIC
jgi:hypothetical protein